MCARRKEERMRRGGEAGRGRETERDGGRRERRAAKDRVRRTSHSRRRRCRRRRRRWSGLECAFGRVAEFVLHRGHRDITRVTLAGADRDARRCLCIAARALHLALSCERAMSRSRTRRLLSSSRSHAPPLRHAAIRSFPLSSLRRISHESQCNRSVNLIATR